MTSTNFDTAARSHFEAQPSFSRLDPEASGKYRRPRHVEVEKKHKVVEWLLFGVFGALVVLAVLALYSSYSPEYKVVPNHVAAGIESDRVNVLILGVGGEKHPGGGKDLADAIMLASFKPSTRQVAVVSIPRDLYVKVGRYGRHRINTAHAIGNQSGYPGGGPALTMDTVEQVVGMPVHAFVRLDFAAFERIIDDLGGVEIDVPRSFYDHLFRDRFEAGLQTMNGKRALQYARYRYIDGPEGDNFARERRQQQVVTAVQQKLRSRSADDVFRMMKAMKTLSSHTDTNLTPKQMAWFYRTFHRVSDDDVRTVSLQPLMEPFQVRSIADAGEAIRPRAGDFREVHALSRAIFTETTELNRKRNVELVNMPLTKRSPVVTGGS